MVVATAQENPEHISLFAAYLKKRHPLTYLEMTNGSGQSFETGFCRQFSARAANCHLLSLRKADGSLCAGAVVDVAQHGFSAVYSYYDLLEPRRSLGTYMITALVRIAHQRQLPFVFLGYWIHDAPTMQYKKNFPATEILTQGQWKPLAEVSDPL